MSVKFPKLHIATSVVNRILNVADGLPDPGSQATPGAPTPRVPDPSMQSVELDKRLSQGLTEPLPGLDQAPDPGATLQGDRPLLETLVDPQGG